MSYLDDPRVLFAAERTLLAWQRTAIALMGLGFIVERFGLFLRVVTQLPLTKSQQASSLWFGVLFLSMAATVAVLAAFQFRNVVRSLGEQEIPRGYWINLGVWANLILAAVSMLLAIYFVTSA